MLLLHAAAAMGDFAALLAFPFQVDYGEGEVWQQAVLIGSSRAYTVSQAFPFIPFEYPPLYYGVVRAVACLIPDMLVAGRLVSEVSSLLIVPLVASLVLAGSRSARTAERVAIAVASGLGFLALHPTRSWGPLMRVDLLAVMLSLFGLLLGVRASGQFAGTAVALLVCLASVFTKQTELPAGLAVLAVAARINWRGALAAALVAGGAGLAIAAFLQHATGGGFLLNVVGYNMNRWSWSALLRLVWIERASMLAIVLAAISAVAVLRALRTGWASADEAAVTRAVIVLQFVLASFMLLELGKEGGSINYFLDALSSGCVLIGIALCGLNLTRPHLLTAALLLILAIGGRFPRSPPPRRAPPARPRHQPARADNPGTPLRLHAHLRARSRARRPACDRGDARRLPVRRAGRAGALDAQPVARASLSAGQRGMASLRMRPGAVVSVFSAGGRIARFGRRFLIPRHVWRHCSSPPLRSAALRR